MSSVQVEGHPGPRSPDRVWISRFIIVLVILAVVAGQTPAPGDRSILAASPDSSPGGVRSIEPGSNRISPLAERSYPVSAPAQSRDTLIDVAAPELTAQAALAVDITANSLLYESAADLRLAPASTLKMLTALVAIRVLDPGEMIEIRTEDLVDRTVYSNAGLDVGDVVSARDLLAGTLIPSGGDAAQALARVAGDRLGVRAGSTSMERFVEEMNTLAADVGMANSRFLNPVGIDAPGQYSTARDLAIAGREVLRDPLLAELVAMTTYQITVSGPNARTFEVRNTNQLLPVDRVHGIKTGTTTAAGENLVLVTRRSGNQVLTVILGSQDRYGDVQRMLNFIDERLIWITFGASIEFQGVLSAQERFDFAFGATITKPVSVETGAGLYARLELGRRSGGVAGGSWGYVVFLLDGEELYRLPLIVPG
jgi:serine-type D-Ala-D-Ala carboxypeptidase (penicillin-binding protein 5/6)